MLTPERFCGRRGSWQPSDVSSNRSSSSRAGTGPGWLRTCWRRRSPARCGSSLAVPSAALLPGINTFGDRSVVISLQSALLGIDEGKSTDESARAAASALGPAGSRASWRLSTPRSARAPCLTPCPRSCGSPSARRRRSSWTRPGLPARPRSAARRRCSPTAAPAGARPARRPSRIPARPRSRRTRRRSLSRPPRPRTRSPATTYAVQGGGELGPPRELSIDGASAGVCSLTGSTVSLDGAGTCTIDADQAGDSRYSAAAAGAAGIRVGLVQQTISFSSQRRPAPGSSATPTQSAPSRAPGLPVSLDVAAGSAQICSVSGSTVSLDGAGTCTVVASQAGNHRFAAGRHRRPQSFPVARASQTIVFTSTAPAGGAAGDTYAVKATASSGLPVMLTIDPASAAVCSLSSGTVSLDAPAPCVVHADQAGDQRYAPRRRPQQTFTIVRSRADDLVQLGVPGRRGRRRPYAVWAESTSGLPVATLGRPGERRRLLALRRDGRVHRRGPLLDRCRADRAARATHRRRRRSKPSPSAAPCRSCPSRPRRPSARSSATPTRSAPSRARPPGHALGRSGQRRRLHARRLDAHGRRHRHLHRRRRPGRNAGHFPAIEVGQTFTVALGAQTIAFTSTAPSAGLVGDTYAVTAAASSGLPVALSIDSGQRRRLLAHRLDGLARRRRHLHVAADQAGNGRYAAAPQVVRVVPRLAGLADRLPSPRAPPSGAVVGDTYAVSASASSGLPVRITTTGSSVCTASGSTVSLVGSGSCTVRAAPDRQPSLRAGRAGEPDVLRLARASRRSPSTRRRRSTRRSAARTRSPRRRARACRSRSRSSRRARASARSAARRVSFDGVGTCTVDADQAGNGDATQRRRRRSRRFLVEAAPRSPQTISFHLDASRRARRSAAHYAVSATASSGLTVAFSIAPASAGICTLGGSTVSFVGAGTCTIDADQPGDASYQAAPQAQQSFPIAARRRPRRRRSPSPRRPPGGATVGGHATRSARPRAPASP